MSAYTVGRKRLGVLIAALCLLLVRHPMSIVSGAAQGGGCGPSMQGVDRLKADLGLDNALANRANSLASSALKNGQSPAPKDVQSLTDDSLDGLNDAGDQLDQAAGEIGKQLDTMNLPRQQRLWTKGVSDMKAARTTFRSALRQDPIARGQNLSLSPSGVGPRTLYEAATSYETSVQDLGNIADQSGFQEIGQRNWIEQGKPDTPPPPNPGPDPWQEWLKRLRAQQARIRNNVNGLNAAQALRAGQFQQAQQNVADMQKALQEAQGLANQLGQMAALCNQAVNQRPSQGSQSKPPQGGQGSSTTPSAATPAAGGGGGGGALIGGVLVAGAAVGGYALYKAMECAEPDMSDSTACGSGSCSACVRMIEKLVPYCDCAEQKHPNEASGVSAACRSSLAEMRSIKAYYRCDVPVLFSPVPESAIVR